MPNAPPLTLWDHAFASLTFVLLPAYATYAAATVFEKIDQEGEPARIRAYQQTMMTWLILVLLLIVIWTLHGREWRAMGFRFPELVPLVVALAATALLLGMLLLPLRHLLRSGASIEAVEQRIGRISLLLPRSRTEGSWFRLLSVNAGITEEIVFRGYLIWYLQHFLPLIWSAVVAAVIFGLGHLYQGARQLPGLLIVSAATVLLYVYTQSLLVPVVLHILLDTLQGRLYVDFHRSRSARS